MPLPSGSPSARRTVTIACAGVALVAVIGAVVYASGSVGNSCGSAWAARTKPLPSPLLTQAEEEAVSRERRNPYEARVEKTRPIQECRRAGNRRLVTAGAGSLVLLLPALGVFIYAFLYWPGQED